MCVLFRFLQAKEVMKSAGLRFFFFFSKKSTINVVYIAVCVVLEGGQRGVSLLACFVRVRACVRVCCYSSAL